ncbi:MAG: hypothetical protein AABW50_00095 [Nanoarchaeota archaeon]
MYKKSQTTILIIITSILLLTASILIIFTFFRGTVGYSLDTEASVSTKVGNISFGEKIDVEDESIIKESARANNLIKYSISAVGFAAAFFLVILGINYIKKWSKH